VRVYKQIKPRNCKHFLRRRGHNAADLQQHCPKPSGRGRPINDMGAKGGQRSTTPGKGRGRRFDLGSSISEEISGSCGLLTCFLAALAAIFANPCPLQYCGRGPTLGRRLHPGLGKGFRQKFAHSTRVGAEVSIEIANRMRGRAEVVWAEDLGVLREQ
jgi:hypothetical protein